MALLQGSKRKDGRKKGILNYGKYTKETIAYHRILHILAFCLCCFVSVFKRNCSVITSLSFVLCDRNCPDFIYYSPASLRKRHYLVKLYVHTLSIFNAQTKKRFSPTFAVEPKTTFYVHSSINVQHNKL